VNRYKKTEKQKPAMVPRINANCCARLQSAVQLQFGFSASLLQSCRCATPDTGHPLLLVLPPLLWAGNAVVGRLVHALVPPMTLNFLR
jgi:hypothetical protein